jgi:hypothetical protein
VKIIKETPTFKLLFLETSNIPPIARIFLWRSECDGSDELISVTPDCTNSAEMDKQIDRLLADLEEVRREGHRQFASGRPSLPSRHE